MYRTVTACLLGIAFAGFLIYLFFWLKKGKRPSWGLPLATCIFVLLICLSSWFSSYEMTQYLILEETSRIDVTPPQGHSVSLSGDLCFPSHAPVGIPQSAVRTENLYLRGGQVVGSVSFTIPKHTDIKMDLLSLPVSNETIGWAEALPALNRVFLFRHVDTYYTLVNPNFYARGKPYYLPPECFLAVLDSLY